MENRVRILLVDDDPEFVSAVKATFSKTYHVTTAQNKAEAQDISRFDRPDLVILGTLSPRGDAYSLHQWVKNRPGMSDIPIIVVDAPVEEQNTRGWTRDEASRLEVEDYIRKPLPATALEPLVSRLLDRVTRRIKVLVADDHAVVREGIRALLSLQRDMQVVGEAVNGKEATEKTLQFLPDVVLMDIVMPVMNGLDATRSIAKCCDKVKVLMLSQYDDEENVLASRQAGAFGFVPKRSVSSDLLAAIRAAHRGERYKQGAAA
ncbi:MAG: response regulator [Chloroflexota bacterium]|nr:response regulator [Chloroflexota bacterium]